LVPTPRNVFEPVHPRAVVMEQPPLLEQQVPTKALLWQKVVETQAVPAP